MPVYDANEYLGCLFCDLNLQLVGNLLTDITPSPSGFAMLLTKSGCLVSAPDIAYQTLFGAHANYSSSSWKCLSDSSMNFSSV